MADFSGWPLSRGARIPEQRRGQAVRVAVDDVPGLDELVAAAARRAQSLGVPLELAGAYVGASHAARSSMMRLMDRALLVARSAVPGIEVRIGTLPQRDVERTR